MRKMFSAALIGLTAMGGAVVAGTAQAQPYGYYSPGYSGYYDNGYYRPAPSYNGYYGNRNYNYNGYNGYNGYSGYSGYDSSAGLAGALIGSLVGPGYGSYGAGVPVDRYGPDPNGMIAPDGHRIKCKLRDDWDSRFDRYMTHRECD